MKSDRLAMFLAGVGIGLAAAVLLAPYSGAETRKRIRDSASQAGDLLKEQAEKLGSAARDTVSEGQRTWADVQEQGKQAIGDIKDKVDEAATRG